MRKQTSATGARNGPAGFVDLVGRVKPNGGAPLCRNAEILKSLIRVQFPTSFFVYFFAQCENCGEPRLLYCYRLARQG